MMSLSENRKTIKDHFNKYLSNCPKNFVMQPWDVSKSVRVKSFNTTSPKMLMSL